jgi:hypothetical protein
METRKRDDRLNLIVHLGQAEIAVYEQVRKELNLKIPVLVTLALKLLLLVAKTMKEGGCLKLVRPNGQEAVVEILELAGLEKGGVNATGD